MAITCSEERCGDQEENSTDPADVTARPWMQEWPRHQTRVPAGKDAWSVLWRGRSSHTCQTMEITPETQRPKRGLISTPAGSGGTLSGQMSGCLRFGAFCSGDTTVICEAPLGAPPTLACQALSCTHTHTHTIK